MSRSGDRTSTFDPSHSDNLLHGLNLLWRKQLFCDVTLTAQGQQFHCHKAVLASCSQYFRSLFSSHPPLGGGVGGQDGLGPPKDQQPPQQQPPPPQEEPGTPSSSPDDKLLTSPRAINNLVLQGCSSIGLRLVLEYLYTANVTLSLDTVEEVLSVSKILHIPQVTKLCVQFLNDQISVQNYKQVCKIAALHGLEETKKLANKYLVEDVLLLNFEEMRALLDSLPPPVESELALFQMSVLWLEHDRETRMQYAPDLMKRLRFALIPAPELVERVQSVDFMRTDPVCQKLLLDAMNYHLMPFRQHCRQSLASRYETTKRGGGGGGREAGGRGGGRQEEDRGGLGGRLRQAENKRKRTIQTVWGKLISESLKGQQETGLTASPSSRKPTFSISPEPEMWDLRAETDRQVGSKARQLEVQLWSPFYPGFPLHLKRCLLKKKGSVMRSPHPSPPLSCLGQAEVPGDARGGKLSFILTLKLFSVFQRLGFA